MNPSRPDVVFDCNVFLQAISRANGPASQALRLVERSVVTLHVSKPIIRELRAILAYPEIRERNPQLTDDVVTTFVNRLLFRGILSREVPSVFTLSRDPDDAPYVDLAAAVSADYLVTRDRDLLDLATDHSIEAKEFRQRFSGSSILDPVDFLNEMRRRFPDARPE